MAAELARGYGETSRLPCLIAEMGEILDEACAKYGYSFSSDSESDFESSLPWASIKDCNLPGAEILKSLVFSTLALGPYDNIGWDQKKSDAGEDDDEDSDEGCFVANGYRKMTKEEHKDYNNQINENMGFDVVVPTDVAGCGILKPFWRSFEVDEPVSNLLKYCAELAVKSYNKNYKTTFAFGKLLKANKETCCSVNYITFEAMDGSGVHETFQAIVHEEAPLSGYKVCFCRIKPKS
ncbi:uncharacterized protein LOC131300713 isoform X2 [Rhododendron vialii]|uniref:uncharacterized protein LOC131300713 isoform X2 n=1 Tax=Rhododendron vialii TaxID=182163 RepID=UPI0026603B21|nr:uncharacterized protein LOC131300713 isoform X2 [Rhododendron vialii]